MRDWLKEARLSKDYKSCKMVAVKLGISQSHYTSIENGSRRPSIKIAKKIAELLEIDWLRFY